MGRIVSNFFISLDGVVESPDQWHFPYFNDEMGAAIGAGMETSGAFLMGRTLYDEWSSYWPGSTDEPFATFINQHPKYVVSSSLSEATWTNTTVLAGDQARLQEVKDTTDGDLTMSGSPTTVRWLLANDLLDELHLLIHPIAVGHGQRLFQDVSTTPLVLDRCTTFSTGVLHAVYQPAAG